MDTENRVFPEFKIVPLAECAPGDLVRVLEYGAPVCYSLVARSSAGDSLLIHFDNDKVLVRKVQSGDRSNVIKYNDNIIFDIDHDVNFEPYRNDMYSKNGAIVVSGDDILLNAGFESMIRGIVNIQIDIAKFEEAENVYSSSDMPAFGSWRLLVDRPYLKADRLVELYKFKVS